MTSFLEESPGVKSSARLAALLAIGACVIVALACAFAIVYAALNPNGREGLAGLLGTASAIIGALGGTAWGALKARSEAGAADAGAM